MLYHRCFTALDMTTGYRIRDTRDRVLNSRVRSQSTSQKEFLGEADDTDTGRLCSKNDEDLALPHWAGVLPLTLQPGTPIRADGLDPATPLPSYLTDYRRG